VDHTTLQLGRWLSIGIGGLFGYELLSLSFRNRLKDYLNVDLFGTIAILAGVALVALAALKAYGQWKYPAVDCCHDHGHDHDHGHSHSHGVSLWRLMILVFPLAMLLCGLVPQQLTAQAIASRMSADQLKQLGAASSLPPERQKAIKEGKAEQVRATLPELMSAAKDAKARDYWEDANSPRVVAIIGEFLRTTQFDDRYQLMQRKMTCCTADSTPVAVTVLGKPEQDWNYGEWVESIGAISFAKDSQGAFHPVLHQLKATKQKRPPPDIYVR